MKNVKKNPSPAQPMRDYYFLRYMINPGYAIE